MAWKMYYKATIPLAPVAQQRHRHTNRGGRIIIYDPSATDKKNIRNVVMMMGIVNPRPGPISVNMTVHLARPKCRKGEVHVPTKPDLDNYIKLLLDSMNSVMYKDDGQVSKIFAEKVYTDGEPRWDVEFSCLEVG